MKSMVSTVELAKRIPVLSHLSEKQALDLSSHCMKCRFEKGEVLSSPGFVSSRVSVLLAGRAKVVSVGKPSRDIILYKMQAGDVVDGLSAIDGEPNSVTVIAESRTDVLTLDKLNFMSCVYSNGALAHALMKGMAKRVRLPERRIESLSLLNVKERICQTLMDLAVPIGEGRWLVPEYLPRTDLSKMVGASREMVCRVMKEIEASDCLSIDGHRRITLKPQMDDKTTLH